MVSSTNKKLDQLNNEVQSLKEKTSKL